MNNNLVNYSSSKRLPPIELELIIAHILKKSREYVLAHPEVVLSAKQKAVCEEFVRRRLEGEPLAYILGHKEFFGLDFNVNKHVLIPRPETELMVERTLGYIKEACRFKRCMLIDIGTGSGCIPIAIAKNIASILPEYKPYPYAPGAAHSSNDKVPVPALDILAVDISQPALEVAMSNAAKNEVSDRITFRESDLLSSLAPGTFEKSCHYIITANLPYVSDALYEDTPVSVKNYEPAIALVSGPDGLDHYRKLLLQLRNTLRQTRAVSLKLFFEISPEQQPLIKDMVGEYFPAAMIALFKDLAQKWRLVEITL